MPTYRIEQRPAASPDSAWTFVQDVTTADVPTPSSPAILTVTGLTNGTEYEFRVIRQLAGSVALESRARRARPSAFFVSADPVNTAIEVTWSDGRGGTSFRVDRWATATPGTVTSTDVSVTGNGTTQGSLSITGLSNGTRYGVQVHRLNAQGNIQRSTEVAEAAPDAEFEPPPDGYIADGPSSSGDGIKAQFATKDGMRGLIISMNNASWTSVTVAYDYVVSGSTTTVTTSWNRAGGTGTFQAPSMGTVLRNNKSYFLLVPNDRFPVLVPGTQVLGATVSLVQPSKAAVAITVTYVA